MNKKVLFIVGPTASGKTRLSIEIAKKIDAEIISADSRQIFKDLNIGTAKPSKEELKTVRHHFIDMYEANHSYNAGIFSRESRVLINQLFLTKKTPLVVGGSGLYIKAMIDGFSVEQVGDEQIRDSLKKRVEKEGSEKLYRELLECDPISAKKIHPNNKQRLIRAMEIYLKTGKTMSEHQFQKPKPADFNPIMLALDWEREDLYRNIDLRVEQMINDGLLGEVARLKRKGYSEDLNSLQTVGYKEVFEYINGSISFSEMMIKIKKNSRNYAKRQLTWFRNHQSVKWLKVDYSTNYSSLADEVIDYFKKVDTNLINEN